MLLFVDYCHGSRGLLELSLEVLLGLLLLHFDLLLQVLLKVVIALAGLVLLLHVSDLQLLAPQLPELLELLLLLLLSRLLPPSLLLLLIPRLFNGCLKLLPTALLLLKESKGLLLGLLYLLVQDLVLPVLHVAEDLSLALDQALAGLLLLPEFLLLLVLLQLVESRLLTGVLLYLGLFLLLLLGELGLLDLKLLVCLSEGLHLLERLFLALSLLVGLARQLFFDLAVDELGLEDLVLHPLDILHLELVQLLVDDLCVGHLALVLID